MSAYQPAISDERHAFVLLLGRLRHKTVAAALDHWAEHTDGTLTILPPGAQPDWEVCGVWTDEQVYGCDPFPSGGIDATAAASPTPCKRVFGGVATKFVACPFVAVACSRSGANFASDHAPWAGDNEERVEVTSGFITAGDTLVAIVANNIASTSRASNPTTVYDQRGNTWTRDAIHTNTSSSLKDRIEIWRCNLTTSLQSGDYIRWAANLGASLQPGVEVGGRCLGVYLYPGTLGNPVVGTGAGSFSANGSVGAPAGDVVIGSASLGSGSMGDPGDAVTGNFDDMIPATNTAGGASNNGKAVFAQHRLNAGAATWQLTHGTVDWAAIAVGYTRT